MKTKIGLFVLYLLLVQCNQYHYLPDSREIGCEVYGSAITLKFADHKIIHGELIAIDSNELIILRDANIYDQKGDSSPDRANIVRIPISGFIKEVKVKYANAPNYAWTVPVFTLWSITHGFAGAVTLPLNLISTFVIAGSTQNDFILQMSVDDIEEMSKYARFPKGVPTGINLDELPPKQTPYERKFK